MQNNAITDDSDSLSTRFCLRCLSNLSGRQLTQTKRTNMRRADQGSLSRWLLGVGTEPRPVRQTLLFSAQTPDSVSVSSLLWFAFLYSALLFSTLNCRSPPLHCRSCNTADSLSLHSTVQHHCQWHWSSFSALLCSELLYATLLISSVCNTAVYHVSAPTTQWFRATSTLLFSCAILRGLYHFQKFSFL